MDELDRKILVALADDARRPLSRVAEELGVGSTTVHQRVRRMEERGVIVGSRLLVDWEAVGLPVVALVSIEVAEDAPLRDQADQLAENPYVQNCFAVTGEFDLLAVIRAHSSSHLGEILEDLRHLVPGRTRTVIVLSTYFDGRVPPLGEPVSD
ncbi:MAG: Lrp/AsnC family transcriptional regulator [Acidimicrobiia bacterium]|nr:Lrp/AsnC family transcriptional regulator [Acidimicrobiia bacterium]